MALLTPGADRFKVLALLKKSRYKMVTLVEELASGQQRVARLLRQPPGDSELLLLEGIAAQARVLKPVAHPNLPRFDKVVEGAGGTWMMFVPEPGVVLSQYAGGEMAVPTPWVVWWLYHLLQALDGLHTLSPPLHVGYIEPSDIVVRGERLFLIDLGLFEHIFPEVAALGQREFVNFIAPEKRMSAQPAAVADLFSAGAIAFWLLTGHAPVVSGPAAGPRLRAVLDEYRTDLNPVVADLVAQLLDFYPSQRPTTARASLARLTPAVGDMAGQPLPAPPGLADDKVAAETTRPIFDIQAPSPIFPDTAETQPPLNSVAVPSSGRSRVVAAVAVCALLVSLALFGLKQARRPGLQGTKDAAPARITAGEFLHEAGGQWQRTSDILPGELLTAGGTEAAVLKLHDSVLSLEPNTTLTSQGGEGHLYRFQVDQGVLHAQSGPVDALEVRLPNQNVLHIDPGSDVTVDLTVEDDAVGVATCKSGAGSLTWHTRVQPLLAGASLRLVPPRSNDTLP